MRPTRLPQVPEAGEWWLEIASSGIDGLDMLQVSGCAVQANISKRQTNLGQSAKSSQRLILELEYLRLAPECIDRLRASGDYDLSAQLQQARHDKQAQLPALIFNATLGSNEYRSFWLTTRAAGGYPRVSAELAGSALHAINDQVHRWLNGNYDVNNRDFELMLSDVAGGNAGTQLQDWTRQADWLGTASDSLERQLAQNTLCTEDKHRFAKRIARLSQQFSDIIEPLAHQSQQRYWSITAQINALETQVANALPEHYRRWMNDRDQRAAALDSAAQRHADLLTSLQQACTNR